MKLGIVCLLVDLVGLSA